MEPSYLILAAAKLLLRIGLVAWALRTLMVPPSLLPAAMVLPSGL